MMTRRPPSILPALRISVDEDVPLEVIAGSTPRRHAAIAQGGQGDATAPHYTHAGSQDPDPRTMGRINHLENRLAVQERNTGSLVDRAYKIREDIIDSLALTRGSWQDERHAREILQQHINSITGVVRRLSYDIQVLEAKLREREGQVAGAQSELKNLELSHVGGITDLRGRVVRCDAAIVRLTADMAAAAGAIRTLVDQQKEQATKVVDRLHGLDSKIREVNMTVEKSTSDHLTQLRAVESGSTQQLAGVDAKSRALADGVKVALQNAAQSERAEREGLELRLVERLERALQLRDAKMENLSLKTEEAANGINATLKRMQEEAAKDRADNAAAIQSLEERCNAAHESATARQADDVRRLKQEYRVGFSTVLDNIAESKGVVEGKILLLEEQLRKELGQVRKMVVLI